ncbi:TetR/AcrR family transcriptional regulator [Caballeronia sp. EK]|uniref:TetR/AcrR family transcriptional regulator n=1 Tax=Caballeronia sp. EK TaxID=2767469 RepID=UPI001655ACE8|nr:TetR/AcrR family transcriptional regulator [Caballeronia sp. EK]MBC8642550.1 TetR/AcrR family transcriptional regulator [Caballeronia sp. EK]
MKRKLLTRAERKERTRERLLEAAETMFVRKGLAATSVDDISEEAGYTRGAFYSNFDSKAEVLIELLRHDVERTCTNMQAIMKEGGTSDEMKQRAIAYFTDSLRPDSFSLWAEASLLASRDVAYRVAINALRNQRLAATGEYIRSIRTADQAKLSRGQAETLALGMTSISDGITSFRMTAGQNMSDEGLMTVAVAFLSWVIEHDPECGD